ncbi:MAG: TolC family protein [Desulfocapsaceae bacterium]|jgi:outer membrane protein TolC|nr:TolC family protein [Desulfocapsaceae bacterium]
MKLCSILIALLLLPQAALALSLEQMQQTALDNRPLVKRYEAEIEKSAENIRIARSGYYPSFDIFYNTYALDEATITEQQENSVFSSALSWNIFSGFKDKYSISSAESIRNVESFRLLSIEQDIQLAVALNYLAVYNQQARLKVAGDNFKTLERLYLDSQNRYEVGLIDRNAVLKFKVDYDNAKLAVQKEEAEKAKALHQLSRVVNVQIEDEDLDFAEFKAPPVIDYQDGLEQQMLDRRSELKVLESLAESAEYSVQAQYGDYYPQVDLVGRYRNYDDSFINGQGELSDDELRAELVLSFNLFDGFQDEAEIARAKADVRSINYDRAELQDELKTALKNILVDYEISLANIDVAREDINSAEENLRITDLKYKEGVQRQIDLLDAVSNLSRAQSNYVTVVKTVFENYFRVMRMTEGFPGRK